MPPEAAAVIGQSLDQVDAVLGQRGEDETDSEELVLQCRPDSGSCDEVDGAPRRQSPPAPRD